MKMQGKRTNRSRFETDLDNENDNLSDCDSIEIPKGRLSHRDRLYDKVNHIQRIRIYLSVKKGRDELIHPIQTSQFLR